MTITDKDFADALLLHPCPECGEKGGLKIINMILRMEHLNQFVEASGEGVMCNFCDGKFMSDDLTENIANQINKLENKNTYLELNRENGSFNESFLN